MSHGAPGGAAAPAQTGPHSEKAEKLNFHIKSLQYFLGTVVNMTHSELGYNDNINMLTNIIEEHTAEILSTLAFATTGDILQSSFITAVTQGLKMIMHSWWGRIAPGIAMPMHLYSAIDELGQMVNYANTKANHTPFFPPNAVQPKVNITPGVKRDPHQVLIQELNRENHKNNNVSKNDKNKKGNNNNGKNGKDGNQKGNQNQNNGGNKGNEPRRQQQPARRWRWRWQPWRKRTRRWTRSWTRRPRKLKHHLHCTSANTCVGPFPPRVRPRASKEIRKRAEGQQPEEPYATRPRTGLYYFDWEVRENWEGWWTE
jgi:hypothetical protein